MRNSYEILKNQIKNCEKQCLKIGGCTVIHSYRNILFVIERKIMIIDIEEFYQNNLLCGCYNCVVLPKCGRSTTMMGLCKARKDLRIRVSSLDRHVLDQCGNSNSEIVSRFSP